jgi:hypothetical protein
VGPSSMSCQLMVGFFAFAKSFDIRVDKKELEGNDPSFLLEELVFIVKLWDFIFFHFS